MPQAAKTAPAAAALPLPTQEIEMKSEARAVGPQPEELVELFQVSHPRLHSAHYTLFGARFLSVHCKRPLGRAQRYWLDLSVLDPTPHLLTIVDRRWLYIAGSLSLATVVLLAASALSQTPWHQQAWMPGTILMLNASLVAFVVFFQRSRSLVRFHSRHGDAMLLELSNNLPSRQEFRDFMRVLLHRIQAAHKGNQHKPHRRLGAELVEHRRLLEAGVLDRGAYDQAREKILRLHRQAHIRPPAPDKRPAQRRPVNADVIEITLAEDARRTDVTSIDLFESGKPGK